MPDRVWLPEVQVREKGLLVYGIPDPPFDHRRNITFGGKKAYSGQMTAGAKKRLQKCLDVLLQISPTKQVVNRHSGRTNSFRLTFLTLTISSRQLIDHREAYEKGLELFLLKMRRSWAKQYLWKAELQARGQIHYHIATNQFIMWTDVKNFWNGLQRRAGWLDEYHREHGHWGPNSTDIHAVEKVKDIGAYLGKYLSKEPGAVVNSKVWGASSDLMRAKRFSVELSSGTGNRLERGVENGSVKRVQLEQCSLYQCAYPEFLLEPNEQFQYKLWRSQFA